MYIGAANEQFLKSALMSNEKQSVDYELLSLREREVMLLAAQGITNKAIARELNITEGTIKLHLHHVYQKLGIRNRFALAVTLSRPPAQRLDVRARIVRSARKGSR
jgi:DNA-binding NarL/FixJ family response regulator